MTVRAILSRKGRGVVTVAPTATLDVAVKLLADNHIGAVVVTEGDRRVVGILSERDIVRAAADTAVSLLATPVSDVMTRKVITCEEADSIMAIMELMTAGRFRHVPVIAHGELAGIVSIRDLVEFRLEHMERESESLRDYIRTA